MGECRLGKLLSNLSPSLLEGEFVFISFPELQYGDRIDLEPLASFSEREGLTLVVPKAKADASGEKYQSVFRVITLNVHSSLDAVGLTAAVASTLAQEGLSANVIAGFYHDHVFVQSDVAERAMAALNAI